MADFDELELSSLLSLPQKKFLIGNLICEHCKKFGFSSRSSLSNHRKRCINKMSSTTEATTTTPANKKKRPLAETKSTKARQILELLVTKFETIQKTNDADMVKRKKFFNYLKTPQIFEMVDQVNRLLVDDLDTARIDSFAQLKGEQEELRNEISSEVFDYYMNNCSYYLTCSQDELEQQLKVLQQEIQTVNYMISYGNSVFDPHSKMKMLHRQIVDFIETNRLPDEVRPAEDLESMFTLKRQDSLSAIERQVQRRQTRVGSSITTSLPDHVRELFNHHRNAPASSSAHDDIQDIADYYTNEQLRAMAEADENN